MVLEEVDLDDAPGMEIPEEDFDDLDEYSFSKFASMYFQGAATPTHIRQRLHQPLLYHEDENDVQVKPPLTLTCFWLIYDVLFSTAQFLLSCCVTLSIRAYYCSFLLLRRLH